MLKRISLMFRGYEFLKKKNRRFQSFLSLSVPKTPKIYVDICSRYTLWHVQEYYPKFLVSTTSIIQLKICSWKQIKILKNFAVISWYWNIYIRDLCDALYLLKLFVVVTSRERTKIYTLHNHLYMQFLTVCISCWN